MLQTLCVSVRGEEKMIQYIETMPTFEEFNALSDSVGWGRTNIEIIKNALKHTIYSVCAYDDDKIVGFGRLIGDVTMFLYIQDVMVLPAYQGKQIGTAIMKHLIGKVNELKKDNPDIRTYLGASKGKEVFYKKLGFMTREEAGLGAGMVLF